MTRPLRDESGSRDRGIYEAAKVHAMRRGIDFDEWPHQQVVVPDEFRWMREAITVYNSHRGFRELADSIRVTLDAHYPEDIIPGPYRADADPGVRFIVKLREALGELPDA